MRSHLPRAVLLLAALSAGLVRAEVPTPSAPAAATPAAAPAADPQDSADAKLAIVLRSYTLLQGENDQLKAAQEKLLAEKSSLEAQLTVAKSALPLADQAAALHEQLRQTQNQLAALALENSQLRSRLANSGVPQSSSYSTPAPSAAPLTAATGPAPAPAPSVRTHVIAEGDTLG